MSLAEKLLIAAQNVPKVFEAGKTSAIQGISPAVIDTSVFQEKLQTIANNTIRVFEAGRQSANMLKATASGAVVRVDDVNPTEHELGVMLSSDTLTDFSGISVTRYGKNLCPTSTLQVQGNRAWTSALLGKFDLPDGIYTFSCEYDNLTENSSIVGILINDKNGNRITETYGDNGKILRTFAVTNGITLHLYTNFSGTAIETDIIFKKIQLEEGSTATEYEPYKQPQPAVSDADGRVRGLRSLSPTTTLISDSDSVIITADYYKKGAATS